MQYEHLIINRLYIIVVAFPLISFFLVYSVALHAWWQFDVWPFYYDQPDYNDFTGFLKYHEIFATLLAMLTFSLSYFFGMIYWLIGLFDLVFNKKAAFMRVIFLFIIFDLWWLVHFFDPYNIMLWFLD